VFWRDEFSRKAETGMGFQELARLPVKRFYSETRGFILNSEYLWLIERMDEIISDAQTGFRRMVPLFRDWETFLSRTEDKESILPDEFFQALDIVSGVPPAPSSSTAPGISGTPPFLHFSRSGDEFYRLSASAADWRIRPDGSVERATYATTANDLTVTPSGLAAVGRFALPSRLPACYLYQIIPPPGSPLYFGTVVPNYGMAGGGVEVFFPDGCPPGAARLWKTIPIY
jgi:hypothetical protein